MLWRPTKRDMIESARLYSKTKYVVVYGERKAEKWLTDKYEFDEKTAAADMAGTKTSSGRK